MAFKIARLLAVFSFVLALAPYTNAQLRTGSDFVRYVTGMSERQRELAIRQELLNGNLPPFLKNLVPVTLTSSSGTATVFVTPEYLSIGTDRDFLRIPMNLYTASAVADHMGFVLPTRKMVNAIYKQSRVHFTPEPMRPGLQMRSTEYYRIHNEKIEAQAESLRIAPGTLVAGDKKDVVVTRLLSANPGRIAIYGWHRSESAPIQPLSTVHGACYADYSHGIRLVSETAVVNGERRSIYDVLADPRLASLLSDEGPIPDLRDFVKRAADSICTD